MAKRDYFLIVDTETTQNNLVADFGALVVDRKGNIYTEARILVHGVFGIHPLFSTDGSLEFSPESLQRRTAAYERMLKEGSRMLASVAGLNRWLENVQGKYNPYLTAYNINFDVSKCRNTNIDLSIFDKQFCLWYAAQQQWALTKKYKKFVVETHAFCPPTEKRNMSYRTNAETMARFVLNDPSLADEPHQAYEDARYYELPILLKLLKVAKKAQWLNARNINWQALQVKNHFEAK